VFKHVGDVLNADSGRQVDALISHTGFKYFTSIPDATSRACRPSSNRASSVRSSLLNQVPVRAVSPGSDMRFLRRHDDADDVGLNQPLDSLVSA